MTIHRFLFGFFLFLLTTAAFARDPISWSLNQSFPSTVLIAGGDYTIVYTLTNQLPVKLKKPLRIIKKPNTHEFTFGDGCTGHKLAPKQSCTVTVILTPVTPGEKTVQLTITGYDNNSVSLPQQKTSATGASGVTIVPAVVTPLPSTMQVNTSAPFEFSFTNTGTSTATGVTATASNEDFSTTCTATLTPGSSCVITGTFTPTSTTPTIQGVVGAFQYNQGASVGAETITAVEAASGISGTITQGLPSLTVENTNYGVTFSFTNNSGGAVDINQSNSFPTGFTLGSNSCPDGGASFTSGATCTISGTFNSATTGDFTVSVELVPTASPPSPASLSTSTTVTSATAGRTFTFVNDCSFPVWFSLNGANRQNSGADIPCTTDSNCPAGSRCNPTAGTAGQCFWENFGPANNNFELTASGGTNTVLIPDSTDPAIEWSGSISASTGCSGSSCVTANCLNSGGTTACTPGVGFSQPATQAEFTLEKTTVDTYDVEVINGFHLPIEMTPSGAGVTPADYTCGSPGAPTAGNGFGACNWNNATVPNVIYQWVGGGSGASCTSNASCSGGEICGLNIGIEQVCGDFLGFWTADEACAVNSTSAQKYFSCNTYLGSPFPSNTYRMTDLYSCKTPNASQPTLNSCYKSGATTECCGCANWQTLDVTPAIVLPPAPITENCLNTDPIWTSAVQNTLVWMKQACPTAYTYPYDDKSSTFTCSTTGANVTNYTVTFCPGGYSGLPSGAIEGRNG